MPFYIIAFYPKKSAAANGAVPLATCIDSKNAKLAEMKATMALEESFPDSTDNFFKPKICELTANINGRPPVDEFSDHWLTCNVWDEENKTFEHIPTTTTSEDTVDDLDPLAGARLIADLPISARVAYVAMYGAETNELDMEQVSNAIDMVSDDEAPGEMKAFITGLSGIPALQQMYPERLAVLIETMRAQMPPFDSVEDVRKFADKWVADPSQREEKTKGTAELARTFETLDLEVALHVMGINPDDAKASHIRDAKYLKDNRDPAWRGWTTSLRVVPGILDIPRGELWELMADGHKDLKLVSDADARRDYVSSKLHGHPLLPDYQPKMAKVQNLGGGKFSIEGLAGTGTSNEVENTEVVEDQLTELQAHIRDLVTGKTNVVSPDEMAKLLTEKNLGAKLVVKKLAKDYELSGNAFGLLKVDEIHHLTLDVVESWIPDQTDRIAFITARVKFYIDDRTNKDTVEKTVTETKPVETATIAPKTETVQEKTAPEMANPASEVIDPALISEPDDFKSRAEVLEKELADKTGDAAENLSIWKRVQRTDPARTKQQNTTNAKGEITRTVTSIKPTYQYMRATEIFGPFGLGWGVNVVEERFDRGLPMMEPVLDNSGREIAKKVMRDGDGTIMTSLNHTIRIVLWYIHGGKRGEITAYGHTKAIYTNKYGFTVEDEPSKKSLTDATTKALSSLGFSADIYLGLFDDTEYTAENAYEHSLKNASQKADDAVRVREEMDERFAKNTETMRSAISANEIAKIASSLTRTIGSEIKVAKRANDTDHVKYLESRLRRLEEIKNECLAKFEEEKA